MAEFSGIPPVGINSIVRPAPEAPPPAIPSVEAGLKGKGLGGRMASDPRNPPPARFGQRQDRDRADPQQLAGPSPAFQASVLELELDLQNTIARVEAARGKRESDLASGIAAANTEPPQTDPMAEPGNANAAPDPTGPNPLSETPESASDALETGRRVTA